MVRGMAKFQEGDKVVTVKDCRFASFKGGEKMEIVCKFGDVWEIVDRQGKKYLAYEPEIKKVEDDITDDANAFLDRLNQASFQYAQNEIHATAKEKGWWDDGERNIGEMLALIHSEVSEALEAVRGGNPADDKVPEYSGLEAELADVMIRIFDMAGGLELDVIGAMFAKMEYNKGREHKHGKKF